MAEIKCDPVFGDRRILVHHETGRPMTAALYVPVRDVPEYFPPTDPAFLAALVSYILSQVSTDGDK